VACNYVLENGDIRFALADYDRSKVLRIDPILSYSNAIDAQLTAIAVDSSGNTYLTGYTPSANFPTTPGVFQSTYSGGSNGGGDAIIAKLDPTGSTLLFATYLGGSGNDSAGSIALDASGNVIVAGWTSSANFPVNHAFQSALLGIEDAFLSKLDPNGSQLLYSTYLGGSGTDSARGVALDASDRVLVTGSTDSPNFPTSTGTFQTAFGGGSADAFIVKVDTAQSGTASRLFSTYLGGSGEDVPSATAVDASGNAFVTGSTRSTNFPTANAFQSVCASCTRTSSQFGDFVALDAFVSKLNASGTALVYSTFLGGNHRDVGEAIALDSLGNAYVAGETWSPDFPTTPGAFQASLRPIGDAFAFGPADAFVTKLNAAGSTLMYASFIGGGDLDGATGIALDASGNAFLSGFSRSTDFPTVKPLQGHSGGLDCADDFGSYRCSDAIVAQINTSGSTLVSSTYLGGAGADDSGVGIAVDAAGNTYVAGIAGSSFPFTQGALEMSGGGFAAKISPATGSQPTATSLSSSPNPSNPGQAVTLTATVTPAGATGLVSVRDGNTVVGFAALNANGAASLSSSSLSGGSHSIIAEYSGDAKFAASTSAVLTQVVNSISLTTAQTSRTVTKGESTTFPLTVTQTGALSSDIAFSCSGLPAGWSCGFNPATVSAGSGPTQVMLTLQAGSGTAQNLPLTPMNGPGLLRLSALVLLMLGIHFTVRRGNTVYLRPAVALGFAALFLLVAGCGSGGSDTTAQPASAQPVTVNFAVNATSGSASTSMPFTITVR
jgi:Bacterial Ig-like domain (group 3)/Beta-propeller repeat